MWLSPVAIPQNLYLCGSSRLDLVPRFRHPKLTPLRSGYFPRNMWLCAPMHESRADADLPRLHVRPRSGPRCLPRYFFNFLPFFLIKNKLFHKKKNLMKNKFFHKIIDSTNRKLLLFPSEENIFFHFSFYFFCLSF